MLKSGERERLKWREKRWEMIMLERERDVEWEWETWREKRKCGERGKIGERERKTYERIQERRWMRVNDFEREDKWEIERWQKYEPVNF